MKASELIGQLAKLIAEHGDGDVILFDENWNDEPARECDYSHGLDRIYLSPQADEG